MARTVTAESLAKMSGLSPEEALLRLWGGGFFDEIEHDRQPIPIHLHGQAFKLFDLQLIRYAPTKKIRWWLELLEIDREQFSQILEELGCPSPSLAINLPKGAFRKLERKFSDVLETVIYPETDEDQKGDFATISQPKIPPPVWEQIGTRVEMTYLETSDVSAIHAELEKVFRESNDPISPPGVKSLHSLDSAVQRPITAAEIYPTVAMAAASMTQALIKNHPFYNGNKRTAIVAMLVFLDSNGLKLLCSEGELFSFALDVADSNLFKEDRSRFEKIAENEVDFMARWILARTRNGAPDSRVRPLKWNELQDILRAFECQIDVSGRKIIVTRSDPMANSSFRWFRSTPKELKATFDFPHGEVDKGLIQEIRKNLKLDSQYVSNGEFYSPRKVQTAGFILEYSKLLKRLARS